MHRQVTSREHAPGVASAVGRALPSQTAALPGTMVQFYGAQNKVYPPAVQAQVVRQHATHYPAWWHAHHLTHFALWDASGHQASEWMALAEHGALLLTV